CCSNVQEYPGIEKGRNVQKRLHKITELPEQQKMSLSLIIADLQSKLMEVQLERDVLQDTRQKELQSQEKVKVQLRNTIGELEAANQLQQEMLREADSQAEQLKQMVHSHEEVLVELHGILMGCRDSTGRKVCERGNVPSLLLHHLSTAFLDVLQDLDSEVSHLKQKVVLVEEELQSLKKDSQTQKELQQHQFREQARAPNSVHPHQGSHLESTAPQLHSQLGEAKRIYTNKVRDLEEQLHIAPSEVAEAQTEQDQRGQEPVALNAQICRLLMAASKGKNESSGRISSLTVQLETTQEALHKAEEDLAAKQVDLKAAEKAVSGLAEKERALGVPTQEVQELHSQLGSRVLKKGGDCLHKVQSGCGTLKLQVLEKERIIQVFQEQIDRMAQMVVQLGRATGAMEAEKSQLVKEISGWKLKVEELKVVQDEKEARIHEMEARLSLLELEKLHLVNTCSERLRALKELTLEKDELRNELQAGQSQIAGLAEAFEDLKRDYQGEIKEMENTANGLQMHLKSAQAELKQARTALKSMEGSDGNALEAAVRMQKQITAKRRHIDALQSKIQFLEEATTNTAKEKQHLREENSKLSQKLSCVRAENIRLAGELEILRARDKGLKEKLSKMEAALDKASMQFAECQGIIQCQEQEAMRSRLQHTLDVKELQGPGYSSVSASGRLQYLVPLCHLHSAVLPPPLLLASSAPQMPSKLHTSKEEPLEDLKRILQELTGSDSDVASVGLCCSGILPTLLLQIFSPKRFPCLSHPLEEEEDDNDDHDDNSNENDNRRRIFSLASQAIETSEHTPRRLQSKVENLQNLVELLQITSQGARIYPNYSCFTENPRLHVASDQNSGGEDKESQGKVEKALKVKTSVITVM
ncbi:PREDICTED: coiled-coil domain-containing protein 158, partial [Acanthisitta chloris]|uniref:coiled-coil domain-containing protein 158 n=1 Tax=Acanthisitta chloris TaxID=57068 RepID=UPI0004F0F2FD